LVGQGHFEQNMKWGLLMKFLVLHVSTLSLSRYNHVIFSYFHFSVFS